MGRGSSNLAESDNKPKGDTSRNKGNGKEPITVHAISTNNASLTDALGKQGKPIGIKKAISDANPFYNGGDEGDYSNNCQRCVVAYELRRRGFDVVAQPTYAGDTLPSGNKWAGAFMHGKHVKVGASTPKKTQANLEAEMRSYGNGSRGIVKIPGHVFNVENDNGKIRYVDAQTNTVYNSNNVFSRLGRTGSPQVTLMRTDNLKISDRAKKSVSTYTKVAKTIVKNRRNKKK